MTKLGHSGKKSGYSQYHSKSVKNPTEIHQKLSKIQLKMINNLQNETMNNMNELKVDHHFSYARICNSFFASLKHIYHRAEWHYNHINNAKGFAPFFPILPTPNKHLQPKKSWFWYWWIIFEPVTLSRIMFVWLILISFPNFEKDLD